MSTPTPIVRGDLIAAVRQAIVDLNTALGRGVFRDGTEKDPRVPYALLADTAPGDALSGDGGVLMQQRTVTVSIFQVNKRDWDPRLGHKIADGLHGKAVLVGVESDPTTWRRIVLRSRGRVDDIPTEGLAETEVSVSCYGAPVP